MNDFYSYLPEDAIEENLREGLLRMDRLREQEISHLRELAAQITQDSEIHNDWIHSLPDHAPSSLEQSPSDVPVNREMLLQFHERNAEWQSVFLCKEIRRILQSRHELSLQLFFPELNELPQKPLCRIAYQRNSYADAAYFKFSEHVRDPRAIYAHSFISACEDVYNGVCDCCILPVESSAEGQLGSFLRLIAQYELKIVATCDVDGTDAERFTRFALLSRYPAPLTKSGKESFLEILIALEDGKTATFLQSAAQLCGLRLHRVCSLPQKSDRGFFLHFAFQTNGADLYAFLLYLAMRVPQHLPVGIYYHI